MTCSAAPLSLPERLAAPAPGRRGRCTHMCAGTASPGCVCVWAPPRGHPHEPGTREQHTRNAHTVRSLTYPLSQVQVQFCGTSVPCPLQLAGGTMMLWQFSDAMLPDERCAGGQPTACRRVCEAVKGVCVLTLQGSPPCCRLTAHQPAQPYSGHGHSTHSLWFVCNLLFPHPGPVAGRIALITAGELKRHLCASVPHSKIVSALLQI